MKKPASGPPTQSGLRGILARRRMHRVMDKIDQVSARSAGLIVLLYVLLAVSFGVQWGLIATMGLLAILWACRRVVQNPELALSLVSLIVSLVAMAVAAPNLIEVGELVHPSALLVAVAAVPGAFLFQRHRGNRGVTTILIHVGCVLSTFLSAFAMEVSGILVVLWAVLVLAWRSGAGLWLQVQIAKMRSGLAGPHGVGLMSVEGVRDRISGDTDFAVMQTDRFRDEHVLRGAEAEEATAAALDGLPEAWSVLMSRKVPHSRADVDVLAIGPGGVWCIDAKDWQARITAKKVADPVTGQMGYEYRMNGSADTLIDRVLPSVFEATQVQRVLRVNPETVNTVVCFGDRTSLPQDVVTIQIADVQDQATGEVTNPIVYLVRREALAEFLASQPSVHWRYPSRLERSRARRGGVTEDELQEKVNARTALDVAVLADYALLSS